MASNRFLEMRSACGMAQGEWSEALNVSTRSITNWENGITEPHPIFVEKMEALVTELGGDE